MIYKTEAGFWEAIEDEVGVKIPLSKRDELALLIWEHQIACHEPFTNEDVRMAVPRVRAILGGI